jgi:hypothetical protein
MRLQNVLCAYSTAQYGGKLGTGPVQATLHRASWHVHNGTDLHIRQVLDIAQHDYHALFLIELRQTFRHKLFGFRSVTRCIGSRGITSKLPRRMASVTANPF